MLSGKRILLGITGGIAAYKTPLIVRGLKKLGAEVQVVMTEAAKDFVSPISLSTVSENPIHSKYFDAETGEWDNHVELAKWADIFLIAPLSMNTMAKMANGICDNLLLAIYFSLPDPSKVYFAPAMDLDMYAHPQNQANLNRLVSFGNHLIDAEKGELASGLIGKGRMAEVDNIITALSENTAGPLSGVKVLITAGPTYEEIDPVRFIGNYSSGKMGYAIADSALKAGAEVSLISGPTALTPPKGAEFISVKSAEEMHQAVIDRVSDFKLFIMSAAVADYRPKERADQKLKKSDEALEIKLEKNPDILADLCQKKANDQIAIGFALETENAVENANKKLKQKGANLILLNSLSEKGSGFGHNTNQITYIDGSNNPQQSELKSKQELANDIIHKIAETFFSETK